MPEPKTPPQDEEELVEAVFTFKDGTGATVRSRIRELTGPQREKVRKAIASAPWRLEPEAKTQPGRPTVNKRSQLFSRAVPPASSVREQGSEKGAGQAVQGGTSVSAESWHQAEDASPGSSRDCGRRAHKGSP